ncbi:hypothetical protein [Deinococcus planocerae]|uniref:hypothetical protein n=1 Tax=Deinococcus planocerae TaxID=1737569 RepID=UPI000C7F343E|nr:hypothetical protein [Deinococcus planocerae]
MPGNENMTLAELIRAGLGLGSGQERRFTATLDGGEVYEVRLFSQARPGTEGDRGVGVIEDRQMGPGTRKTLGLELTRRS